MHELADEGLENRTGGRAADSSSRLRRILLALVLLDAVGLTIELALLGHTESFSQWLPFAAFAAAIGSGIWVAVHLTRRSVLIFRIVMGLCLLIGVLGIFLHLRGNALFELEVDPSSSGLTLVWAALRGGTPAMAPGALAQLGLLGLAYTYRHPALGSSRVERKDTL